MKESNYTATLTGNPFLLFETQQVAGLLLQGTDRKELLTEAIQTNVFQYKNTKSIMKRFNAIFKRIHDLDRRILEKLAHGTAQEAKIINLLTIVRTDRLFREFVSEIVSERIRTPDRKLEYKDFERFFEYKKETNPEINPWTDKTIKKLIQVYIQILYHSGLIDDRKNKVLQRFLITDEFREKLALSFPREFIDCITG